MLMINKKTRRAAEMQAKIVTMLMERGDGVLAHEASQILDISEIAPLGRRDSMIGCLTA